ncbi:MAG: hypothetical protein ABH874_01995 [Methanobacteriota archaeon]|jgi:hypothetical protein
MSVAENREYPPEEFLREDFIREVEMAEENTKTLASFSKRSNRRKA